MRGAGPRAARCEACGDVIPATSTRSGSIRPIRSGESCECGREEFRLLSDAEADRLRERPTGRMR